MSDMFEIDNQEIKLLVDLAKQGSEFDPIDWGDLNITEHEAYVMMASHVAGMQLDTLTAKAVIVKLLVENFVLNLRIEGKK